VQKRHERRGERVLIRVPVQIRGIAHDGREVSEAAETSVVSRYGALLRTHSRLKHGSALTVQHGFSQEAGEFRVVWLSDKLSEGRWEVGVEAAHAQEDFWGIRFPRR
jgi:hypothetical protein